MVTHADDLQVVDVAADKQAQSPCCAIVGAFLIKLKFWSQWLGDLLSSKLQDMCASTYPGGYAKDIQKPKNQ